MSLDLRWHLDAVVLAGTLSDTWVCCFPVPHFPLPSFLSSTKSISHCRSGVQLGFPARTLTATLKMLCRNVAAQARNPSTGEAEAGGLSSRLTWAILQNCVSKNKTLCPNPISHHVLKQDTILVSSRGTGRCDSHPAAVTSGSL